MSVFLGVFGLFPGIEEWGGNVGFLYLVVGSGRHTIWSSHRAEATQSPAVR